MVTLVPLSKMRYARVESYQSCMSAGRSILKYMVPGNILQRNIAAKGQTVSHRSYASIATCVTDMAIENLRPLAYVVASIAFAIGTCSIFLRLYCRWRLRLFGCDDFVAVSLFVSGFDSWF